MAIEEAEKVTALLPNTSWAHSRRAWADAAGGVRAPCVPPSRLRRPGSLGQAVEPCDEVSWLDFFLLQVCLIAL